MERSEKLKLVTAWDTEPVLTGNELNGTPVVYAMADANGRVPISEEWTPTYNLNAAAAHVWLIKAARAAATVEAEPGSDNVTSKGFENCRSMAKMFAVKRTATVLMR